MTISYLLAILIDMNNNITACILTSNDSYWLPYTLESIKDKFQRYVIYDVGSRDNSREIIEHFVKEYQKLGSEVFVRELPMCEPPVQGAFRNSMIAEAGTDYYLIVDSDEVWRPKDFSKLDLLADKMGANLKPYGVVRRKEFNNDLTKQYTEIRGHHRLYSRKAIWTGTHPGERAVIPQNKNTEVHDEDILVYHFHNADRSPMDHIVPGRKERKAQKTYHPGELIDVNLLEELPILRKRIADFPVCPALEILWQKNNIDS